MKDSGLHDEKRLTALQGAWQVIRHDESGSTTLEYVMLMAAIAIPSVFVMNMVLNLIVENYRLMILLNSLPFP